MSSEYSTCMLDVGDAVGVGMAASNTFKIKCFVSFGAEEGANDGFKEVGKRDGVIEGRLGTNDGKKLGE